MAVFTKQQNLGLSEGNLLCGDMTGQHSKYNYGGEYTIALQSVKRLYTTTQLKFQRRRVILYFTVYLPVNATTGEDVVRLFAMVGSNTFLQLDAPFNLTIDPSFVANYTWSIKIRQIDCSKQDSIKGIPKF